MNWSFPHCPSPGIRCGRRHWATFPGSWDTFAPDREADPRLYRLISACRDALLDERPAELVVAYFEAWLLRLSGLYPRPGRCACGAAFDDGGAAFFASGPVYACCRCAAAHGEPTARLSLGALRLLEAFWVAPPSASLPDISAAGELFRFHGGLTAAFAERASPARHALESILRPGAVGLGEAAR